MILPTMALAGTSMDWDLMFHRQMGTQEGPGCKSPYIAVSTMEAGNWGPCAGSASTQTCMQCIQAPVLPCILMVPNGGMVTF